MRRILFLALYLGGWATGQNIYDAFNFYKPMTDDYDVRYQGQLFLPPCIKNLMNCWEVIRNDLVCKYGVIYRIALESMCMDLRLQCKEYTGPLPFESLNVSVWNFCPTDKTSHDMLDLRPIDAYSRGDGLGVNNWNNVS